MGMINKVQFVPSTEIQNTAITTTDCRGPIVDMEGSEGVLFTFQQSSGASSGGITAFRVMGSTGNSTGNMVPMGGSTGTVITFSSSAYAGATMDDKFVAIDVVKPVGSSAPKRYIQLVVDNCTQVVHFTAMKYGLRHQGSSDIKNASSQVLNTTSIVGAASS
jgi:hypothetical protein